MSALTQGHFIESWRLKKLISLLNLANNVLVCSFDDTYRMMTIVERRGQPKEDVVMVTVQTSGSLFIKFVIHEKSFDGNLRTGLFSSLSGIVDGTVSDSPIILKSSGSNCIL